MATRRPLTSHSDGYIAIGQGRFSAGMRSARVVTEGAVHSFAANAFLRRIYSGGMPEVR